MSIIDVCYAKFLSVWVLFNVFDSDEVLRLSSKFFFECLIISFQVILLDPAFMIVLLRYSDSSRRIVSNHNINYWIHSWSTLMLCQVLEQVLVTLKSWIWLESCLIFQLGFVHSIAMMIMLFIMIILFFISRVIVIISFAFSTLVKKLLPVSAFIIIVRVNVRFWSIFSFFKSFMFLILLFVISKILNFW